MKQQTRQMKTNEIITVIGKKGSGKTTLTEMIVLMLDKPAIIADPRRQYPSDTRRRILFENPKQLLLFLSKTENFKTFYKYKLELICNCSEEDFDELAGIVLQMRDVTFIIDEVDMFFAPNASRKTPLYKICNYGRHNQINIITTARRPADISRSLTSQTDKFYISHVKEQRDLEYLMNISGELADKVTKLEAYQFVYYDTKNIEVLTTKDTDIKMIDKL
jgi:ABC-type dipeptide/oligopeptide/nickel transport system ATPase component